MEIVIYTFRALIWLLVGTAVFELLAAIFLLRVRRYIAQHPIAHCLWLGVSLLLALIYLVPAPSHPDGRRSVLSPNKRAPVQRRASLLVRFDHHWPGVPERGCWGPI